MLLNIRNIAIESKAEIKLTQPNSFLFIFMEEGEMGIAVNKGQEQVFSNGILFVNYEYIDELMIHSSKGSIWLLEIDQLFASDFLLELAGGAKEFSFLKFQHHECYANVLSLCKMLNYEANMHITNAAILSQLLGTFIAIYNTEFMKLRTEEANQHAGNTYVSNLLNLIENNYKLNHTVDFYANHLYISKRHLNNLSRKYFNTSLTNLIIKRKINAAKQFLKDSNMQITEIGYALGFKEKSYFTRVFKSNTGVSPKNYRDQFKNIS